MSSSESFDLLLDKGHSNGLQYSKPGTDYIGHRIYCPWEFRIYIQSCEVERLSDILVNYISNLEPNYL